MRCFKLGTHVSEPFVVYDVKMRGVYQHLSVATLCFTCVMARASTSVLCPVNTTQAP